MCHELNLGLELETDAGDIQRLDRAKRVCEEMHTRFSNLRAFLGDVIADRDEGKTAITNLETAYYMALIGVIRKYRVSSDCIKNLDREEKPCGSGTR